MSLILPSRSRIVFGYPRDVKINTPSVIAEREHGLFWTFKYRKWSDESETSGLADSNVLGLALAARATSSFPGAFPPVQLSNLERLLAQRGLDWPDRQKFIASNFKEHIRAGVDPEITSFLDGGTVNNKPFSVVLNMVRERPAYRDVDRPSSLSNRTRNDRHLHRAATSPASYGPWKGRFLKFRCGRRSITSLPASSSSMRRPSGCARF